MDDAKIDSIAREVLTSLKKVHAGTARAEPGPETQAVTVVVAAAQHPSLGLLSVVGGVVGTPCIIEPDKMCVGSLRCRSFGH